MQIEGDTLFQKRMLTDHALRLKRAAAGQKGGKARSIAKKCWGPELILVGVLLRFLL